MTTQRQKAGTYGNITAPRELIDGRQCIAIEATRLARLYERLCAGETWGALSRDAGCSDFGLKQCFKRAGFDLNVREIRRDKIGKTRNILKRKDADKVSAQFLSISLRAPQ